MEMNASFIGLYAIAAYYLYGHLEKRELLEWLLLLPVLMALTITIINTITYYGNIVPNPLEQNIVSFIASFIILAVCLTIPVSIVLFFRKRKGEVQ
ncbi:hypothetical protein RC101_001989 [Listeria monocytogenes]|uniref:hypothetical protein n=1 Tax=Listeria monocytogenes TaxID=1639 RepID=UPI0011EB00E4|nr:hypothetical protein [Listeria monocytogenes]EAF5857370.1 hypothetical protein [Listeria monocytogenes]ECL4453307.1 hypothetical protein [Listeria monocytogenes]EFO7248235.1 hypothetical protein [Listeria monocytogenes]EHC2215341.1 hypothetical protein [Listeria monocytogenes]EKZ0267412.1 hypothetical protein [Listeria monocytogenes]